MWRGGGPAGHGVIREVVGCHFLPPQPPSLTGRAGRGADQVFQVYVFRVSGFCVVALLSIGSEAKRLPSNKTINCLKD